MTCIEDYRPASIVSTLWKIGSTVTQDRLQGPRWSCQPLRPRVVILLLDVLLVLLFVDVLLLVLLVPVVFLVDLLVVLFVVVFLVAPLGSPVVLLPEFLPALTPAPPAMAPGADDVLRHRLTVRRMVLPVVPSVLMVVAMLPLPRPALPVRPSVELTVRRNVMCMSLLVITLLEPLSMDRVRLTVLPSRSPR